jgi:hypothetical protein
MALSMMVLSAVDWAFQPRTQAKEVQCRQETRTASKAVPSRVTPVVALFSVGVKLFRPEAVYEASRMSGSSTAGKGRIGWA